MDNARIVTQFHEKISNLGILHILRYFAWFRDIDNFQCCCNVLGHNVIWHRCCASAHCSLLVLGSSVSLPWAEKPWKFYVFKGWMTCSMARVLFCICHHGVRWFLSTAGWTLRNSSDMSEDERGLSDHGRMARPSQRSCAMLPVNCMDYSRSTLAAQWSSRGTAYHPAHLTSCLLPAGLLASWSRNFYDKSVVLLWAIISHTNNQFREIWCPLLKYYGLSMQEDCLWKLP